MNVEYIPVGQLKPYAKNARKHEEYDVGQIAESIERYGFNDPIGIWGKDNIIVEGHGRLLAAKKLGMDKVPCIRLDDLTDEQRREYAIMHNKTAELSTWDFDLLAEDIGDLDFSGFDIDWGFTEEGQDFFENRERNNTERQEGNDEYNEFLEKFETKKTTDDCYTPDVVYEAVAGWVENEYGVKRANFVRPFYPGGDYQNYKYRDNAVVVDNPPFSILSEIIKFYCQNNIKFFLFAPTLTLFSSSSSSSCAICVGVGVTYENNATVNTSFITNMETNCRLRSAPTLYRAVKEANDENLKELRRELPKYEYPSYIITSTRCGQFSRYGIDFKVPIAESYHIRQLDAQKERGDAIYGSAYLLSERLKDEKEKAEREKAEREKAEREKAEREKATIWKLSEKEMEIIKSLSNKE